MKGFINYFIKYKNVTRLFTLMIFVFGYIGFSNLKTTFFPQEAIKFVNIDVIFRGASPSEVEEGVVTKIEDNLKGISGIDRYTSVSRENAGNIQIELLDGYDPNLVLQDVQNAVDRISTFPSGIEPPVVYKVEIEELSFSFALSGDVGLATLKKAAREVESDLRNQPGISKVYLDGFPEEEIEVAVTEERLQQFGLTFDEVARAVAQSNIELSGGVIKTETEEISIRARSKDYFAVGLMDIVVRANPNGQRILLSDIAEVRDTWEDRPTRSFLNGDPAVIVRVNNTNEENILSTTEFVRDYINRFNQGNTVIQATEINDRSITLRQRIDLLLNNGLIGAVLVFGFLAISLNFRVAFWTAFSIPASFLIMFMVAPLYGLSINALSLFGMIIVVGILVDDGVVVGENIYQHFEKGKTPFKAALDGTREVISGVVSGIATTVVAFSLFFFVEGRLGEFFSDIAFVVIATLIASLFEVVALLPSHLAHSSALTKEYKQNFVEIYFNKAIQYGRERIYLPLIRFLIKNPAPALVFPIGLFVITIGAFQGGIIKTTFFPNIEQEAVAATLELPVGARDTRTSAILDRIEATIWEINQDYKAKDPQGKDLVLRVQRNIGPLSHQGGVTVYLLNSEERSIQAFAVANRWREATGPVIEADKLVFSQASVFGKPISIALTSRNLDELHGAKELLKQELSRRENLRDIIDNEQTGLQEIDIELKPYASQLGLTLGQVMAQIRQGFFGMEIQSLQRGIDEVKVWIRYDQADRRQLSQLENMRIRTPVGQAIPLAEIGRLTLHEGMVAINHLDGKRQVLVEADLANFSISATDENAIVRKDILPNVFETYPTVSASFEGQTRTATKSGRSATAVLPAIVILFIVIIVWTFRSFSQAFIVLLEVPLSIVGVAWGHYLHGMPLSIFSMLGIIALVGVLVNASIVFIVSFNDLLKEGHSLEKSVLEAASSRFRPIVLTTITTVAGLFPLLLETSFQAQFLIPMAVAIAYGLIFATILTLGVLPAFLIVYSKFKVRIHKLWTGKTCTPEQLEPALIELQGQSDELE